MVGRGLIKINQKKCPNLVADLEQCVFKKGSFEIDKSNPNRTHWLDGFKNMVEYEWPVTKRRGFKQLRYLGGRDGNDPNDR